MFNIIKMFMKLGFKLCDYSLDNGSNCKTVNLEKTFCIVFLQIRCLNIQLKYLLSN
jgi:hypothetical protein